MDEIYGVKEEFNTLTYDLDIHMDNSELDISYPIHDNVYVVRRRGRLTPRQPLSVCALLPAYEGNRHLRPLGNLGHHLRRPRWSD